MKQNDDLKENFLGNTETEQVGLRTFIVLMVMVFSLSPLAIDMYLPALPTMAEFFTSSIDAMEASVAIYLIFFALGQLVLGALADSVNKAKILLVGLSIFALASYMIAQTTTLTELYFWRSLQAFASGSSVVVFALIHQFYGNKQSNQIISYVMACVVVAPLVAPIIGSQILLVANWQWIFLVLSIVAVITLLCQLRFIPPRKAFSTLKPLHFTSLLTGYKTVFSNPITMAYIFAGGSAFAGLFAFISGSPFVYIKFYEVTPTQFSGLVALNAVAMVSMNLVNARLLKDVQPTKKLIMAGKLLCGVGLYLAVIAYLQLPLAYVVVGVVCYVGLLGLTAANAISSALATAKGNTGILSGVNGVLQFGLGALASAVVSISHSVDASAMNYTMAMCSVMTLCCVLYLNKKT